MFTAGIVYDLSAADAGTARNNVSAIAARATRATFRVNRIWVMSAPLGSTHPSS
jgi:hypothetical protein